MAFDKKLSQRERLFLRLVHISVSNGDSLGTIPTTSDWEYMFREAQQQALSGVLFSAVERLPPVERPPRHVLLSWYAFAERVKQANAVLDSEAVQVMKYLEGKGLPAILLKGQGVARLYPEPSMRQPGDIDVWVIAERGVTMKLAKSLNELAPETLLHTELALGGKTTVEAHFMPSYSYNPWRHRVMQRLFASFKAEALVCKVTLGEVGMVSVPTPAMNRVYLLCHLYRHLFDEGVGLRQLMDYYYCLRQGLTESEARETRDVVKRLGMARFASAVLWVLVKLLDLPESYCFLPPAAGQGSRFLSEVMDAGNFGRKRIPEIGNIQENKIDKFWRKTRRNWHFLRDYPDEVLFDVPFRLWHYAWRQWRRWH